MTTNSTSETEDTPDCDICGDSDTIVVATFVEDGDGVVRHLCERDAARLERWWKQSQELRYDEDESSGTQPTMTCSNGHETPVDEMDTVGMDYRCPECFEVVRPHE